MYLRLDDIQPTPSDLNQSKNDNIDISDEAIGCASEDSDEEFCAKEEPQLEQQDKTETNDNVIQEYKSQPNNKTESLKESKDSKINKDK